MFKKIICFLKKAKDWFLGVFRDAQKRRRIILLFSRVTLFSLSIGILYSFLLDPESSSVMTEKNSEADDQLAVTSVPEDMPIISYPDFVKLLDSGDVDIVCYNPNEPYMWFVTGNADTEGLSESEILAHKYESSQYGKTQFPASDNFRSDLLSRGVVLVFDEPVIKSSASITTSVLNLFSFATTIILFLYIFLMFKNMNGSKMITDSTQDVHVTFDDVIGQDEILDDIRFISGIIHNPEKCDEIGVGVPKGILLSGPPGVGKTLIAKAIAGEADVPFLSISGSDFKELYVGVGAKRVRELFSQARKKAPCVVFIDEIDAVGIKRDRVGTNSEDDQTINALLKEMDGFSGREGVFVIAATNRPDQLDKALVRSGRFDRQIAISPPRDWHVRKDLFSHYLKDMKVSDDVNLENLSKQVAGFTGADIAAVCNEAGIVAMMNGKDCIDGASIEEAIDKKIFNGNRSKREQFDDDRKIVAYHEAGHAVMSYLTGNQIARASIQSTTSGVGGFVSTEESESCFVTDKEMYDRILVAYAGRVSEEIKFGVVTTGASNDITQATNLLTSYIYRYGFDRSGFGLIDLSVLQERSLTDISSMTNHLSEFSIHCYKESRDMLAANYCLVEALATKLLELETISGDEIKHILDNAISTDMDNKEAFYD